VKREKETDVRKYIQKQWDKLSNTAIYHTLWEYSTLERSGNNLLMMKSLYQIA
jgi:hypothetical protein